IRKKRGSALFIHLNTISATGTATTPTQATHGCIALAPKAMLALLPHLHPWKKLHVHPS
ncbi:MAG: hypothetical protein GDA50_00125, partial [Alphaproteobacteria bacterium GM202ARS2]|nr:hypothetical protein [Alphaproteobacteria bacterium GM202ARS2]